MSAFASVTPAQAVGFDVAKSYSAADLGTNTSTWTSVQGPDGMLYFGGDSLISFDGARWRQAPINGASALRGLDFGKDGRLWAAAAGEIGWFDRQSSGDWVYRSLVPELPANERRLGEVWNVFAEDAGAVFVSTDKVIRWNGISFQSWTFLGRDHLTATRLAGVVYVHHLATGLHAITADGPKLLIPASVLGRAGVFWMEKIPDGFLLVTSKGLFTYSKGKLTELASATSDYLRKNVLTCVTRLADGRLTLGTYRGGMALVRADGSIDRIVDEKDGLPTNVVFSLFSDREKNLWITSDSQVLRVSVDSPSAVFDQRHGLPSQPVKLVTKQNNQIIVGIENGLFEFQPDSQTFQPIAATVDHLKDLEPSPDGLLIAGHGRVRRLEGGKTVDLYASQQATFLAKPSRQWPGSTLVAEANSIILVGADGKSRTVVRDLPDFTTSIAEDAKGRLWLGTPAHAILVATLGTSEAVEARPAVKTDGLPDDTGPGLVVAAPDGTVFAFGSSGGWLLGREATRFSAIESYPSRAVVAASEIASDHTLWVVHPEAENRAASVARISLDGDRAVWQPHSAEGLWNVGTPECILAEAGANGNAVLWIGGTSGLLRNIVTGGPIAPAPRPPLLRALARAEKSDTFQAISQPLPYSTPAIAFEFAAPELARRPALRLETMLGGVDQHWIPVDATSRREFSALREGIYDFRVRAVAETGVVGPASVRHFEIMAPWWRTGTALLCGLLALVPAGYGSYRWRVRTLRQHNAELEAKVCERTAQLAKASAAKTQFVANMSHDIRNPLNGIVGLALALEDTNLDKKQSELVTTLRECTTYLSTLVDDVLDFSSIEAGTVQLRPGPFSPGELLRSIAAMFKMEAIASGASLHVQIDSNLPTGYVGDAGRIQQILVNYLTNALKYAGGRIRLSATIPADATEEIEFAVVDEGPGISEGGQRVLFTKFTRLTDSQSKEITGTGLGLASCRLLAGLMSGSVGVQSSPGHGARFFLRLPLEVLPARDPDSLGISVATPVPSNCTVLLVEDTNYNAMAATAVLAKFGLTCERATSGTEALALFAAKRHNLVLLDRNLPDMDGTEVARRIRLLEAEGPRAILLAVTAYCTSEDRALCLGAGMDAFVGKPLTPEKLRRVLTAAGRRHLAAASMHVSPDIKSTGIDISLLEYISDGTDHDLSRQIELFLTALAEAERQLDLAVADADFARLGEAAHAVLSHARLVGCSSLAAAAGGLEHAARAYDNEAFGVVLAQVRQEICSLTATVRRHPDAGRPA